MKYTNHLIGLIVPMTMFVLAAIILTACKKDKVGLTPLASLNVTNAVVGGAIAKLGSNATTVSNNNFAQFGLKAGENNLYVWPVGDSLHPYYNEAKFSINEGEIYSLFLAGTPGAVEAIKIKETIPYR